MAKSYSNCKHFFSYCQILFLQFAIQYNSHRNDLVVFDKFQRVSQKVFDFYMIY